jgi:uncharacterized RDD family membrane protein YckC
VSEVPPGWYDDPGATGALRWWNGTAWTEHTHAIPEATPYGGPPLESGPTTDDGEPLAGFWWRALAYLCDTVLFAMISLLVGLPAQIAVQRELQTLQEQMNRRIERGQDPQLGQFFDQMMQSYTDHAITLFLVPLLVVIVGQAFFLRWKGATPGKLICGLRVRRLAEPGRLPWSAIAARVAVQFLVVDVIYVLGAASGSFAVFIASTFAATGFVLLDDLLATRRNRRALHDMAAGTVVVRTRA